jgi:hypothetical protein
MAHLRLSCVLVLVLLAACNQAGAQGSAVSSGIAAPAGWKALPDIAKAARDAAKAGGVAVASEAWGEPSRGCYAVWLHLSGNGASVEQVLAGISTEKLDTKDIVKPADASGIVSMSFARPPYTGRVRARVESGTVTALACFANQREPLSCETACTGLLGALE